MIAPVDDAAAVALAGLPGMGPARLRFVLEGRSPSQAWAAVRTGLPCCGAGDDRALGPDPAGLRAAWRGAASGVDPIELWSRHRSLGIGVVRRGEPGYPAALAGDPEPPSVLFWLGELGVLDERARVAVVGTRRCTPTGEAVAREMGGSLAAAGVSVVSGLALGIDAAAHRGALGVSGATPVAVVGSGLDVVYPNANASLWAQVAERGVVVSEAPAGARPLPWRFPARNRIIAGLSAVVVVVESPAAGGSLHTAAEAADRGIPVLAVPGSVRNPASAGTNDLLHAGAGPARDALDVLVALGLEGGVDPAATARAPHGPTLDAAARAVLDALAGESATIDDLALRCTLALAEITGALDRLVDAGVVHVDGAWYCRVR